MVPAIWYRRPDGRRSEIDITQVYEDDAQYLNSTNVKVSLEDIGSDLALYFDYGDVDEEGEPIEHIELARLRTCQETIKAAVEKIKEARKERRLI